MKELGPNPARPGIAGPGHRPSPQGLALLFLTLLLRTAAAPASPPDPLSTAGPHHQILEVTPPAVFAARVDPLPWPAVVHLEIGLHRLERGQWIPTDDTIEIQGRHAIARRTAHRVIWTANARHPGAVDLEMPDGLRLRGHCLGLGYYDAASGQSLLLAEVQDCQAELHPPNLLVYPNAFDSLHADLVYLNQRAGLEQFVVLRQAPPPPADLGLNPASTRLEVITEFIEAPRPTKLRRLLRQETRPERRARRAEPDFVDEWLDFGPMSMGVGRAFLPATRDGQALESESLPMAKRWDIIEGRTFLFEAAEYEGLEPLLASLPSPPPSRLFAQRPLAPHRTVPAALPLPTAHPSVRLAAAPAFPPGVVLDYSLQGTLPNYTFAGHTTYYIRGPITLSGTNTTFEAGTVLKFAPTNQARLDVVSSHLTWLATPTRPVILTARDDATVGTPLTAAVPSGYYADVALRFPGPLLDPVLAHLRIAHASTALSFPQGGRPQVSHAQFVQCRTGVQLGAAELALGNALLSQVATNFNLGAGSLRAEHLTVQDAACLNTTPALWLTNSLLVGVATTNAWTGSHNAALPAGLGTFVTLGAGAHYLPASSPYRNAGTTALRPTLLAALRQRTTTAPLLLHSPLDQPVLLQPRAFRDADVPDLGYHYPPLDYLASNAILRAHLVLTNGVALGLAGAFGLDLQPGAAVTSDSLPVMPNQLLGAQLLQEQPLNLGQPAALVLQAPLINPTLRFRGTEFSLRAGATATLFHPGSHAFTEFALQDCTVAPALFAASPATNTPVRVAFTNNLFDRCSLAFTHYMSSQNTPYQVLLFNNLLRAGSLTLTYYPGAANPTWAIHDNLLDGTSQTLSGDGLAHYLTRSHNGFTSGTPTTLGGVSNKSGLSPDFQTGPLGRTYYPATGRGLTQLRDAGSRAAAAAGLFHHTTSIQLAKEATSPVDIGFHYLASLPDGTPLDQDGDGLPDALEDRNGNGNYEATLGESDWQHPASGLSSPASLEVFTPLQPPA